jgi:hypothetical protein
VTTKLIDPISKINTCNLIVEDSAMCSNNYPLEGMDIVESFDTKRLDKICGPFMSTEISNIQNRLNCCESELTLTRRAGRSLGHSMESIPHVEPVQTSFLLATCTRLSWEDTQRTKESCLLVDLCYSGTPLRVAEFCLYSRCCSSPIRPWRSLDRQ